MEKNYYFDFWENDEYEILIIATDQGLCFIDFVNAKTRWNNLQNWIIAKNQVVKLEPNHQKTAIYHQAIDNFFKGQFNFEKIKFDLIGSEFQLKVWKKMFGLQKGYLITYQELAHHLAMPNGARAVARAVAKNPILLLIPCHRIISKRKPFQYRAGPEIKKMLIILEKSWQKQPLKKE